MVEKYGVKMSDEFYAGLTTGNFVYLDVKIYKEKQAVVMICADNNVPIKVVPLGANVHRIIKQDRVCATCDGKGFN